jgi:hypothetical protein
MPEWALDMTGDEFRDLALGMEGAIERAHMGHPDFRANGKIFATLDAKERTGVVNLEPEEQRELVRQQPKVFIPVKGAWGKQGWTTIVLSAAGTADVRAAVVLAWQGAVAATAKPRARRRASAGRGAKRRTKGTRRR